MPRNIKLIIYKPLILSLTKKKCLNQINLLWIYFNVMLTNIIVLFNLFFFLSVGQNYETYSA